MSIEISEFPVPDDLMIEIGNEGRKRFFNRRGQPKCADTYNDSEVAELRALLPHVYHGVPTDIMKNRLTTLRKGDKIESDGVHAPGKGRRSRDFHKDLSPELLAHYDSQEYGDIRSRKMATTEGRCVSCGGVAVECHHHRYDRLNTPDEFNDIVPVCRGCHEFMDERRREQSRKKKATK